ncbi:MAG: DnaJ domain-containing protein [Ktedonobacteraceae bacterium]|nr:DnaJ domain-containing protein [Ktedonobacteraceae bacterium]
MDTSENYYAILGVPIDAEGDTIKRAYRQMARRYHPDIAGPRGALEMKRINRAYAVLSDAEKRQHYDAVIGGVIDLRRGSPARPRPQPHTFDAAEDVAFSGLNIFCTRGPLRAGPVIHSTLGVISALSSVRTVEGMLIAAGSLDGKGMLWQLVHDTVRNQVQFIAHPQFTVESLRELRFSSAGAMLAGWGRLGLHVWDAHSGIRLWSYELGQRAVSAHYSLDATLDGAAGGQRQITMALPLLIADSPAPRAWGVRGTDVVSHVMGTSDASLSVPLVCTEEEIEKRQFWAIRLRSLAQDARTLLTLSCAHMQNEPDEMAVVRCWNFTSRSPFGKKIRPHIVASLVVGRCADCAPPYAVAANARMLAFVHGGQKIVLCDTTTSTYSELLSGTMGGSSRMALSSDGQWVAVAREDSEVNEGVIDLWSVVTNQVAQKLYHPWQVSALHFSDKKLIVALTDGTIQLWH